MKDHDGFTLIEAIIFIIVVTIGFISLSSIYISAIQKSAKGEYLSTSSSLAEEKTEEILAKNFYEINYEPPTRFSQDPSSPFYKYSSEVIRWYTDPNNPDSVVQTETNFKKIIIKITQDGNDKPLLEIITLVSKFQE